MVHLRIPVSSFLPSAVWAGQWCANRKQQGNPPQSSKTMAEPVHLLILIITLRNSKVSQPFALAVCWFNREEVIESAHILWNCWSLIQRRPDFDHRRSLCPAFKVGAAKFGTPSCWTRSTRTAFGRSKEVQL